MTLALTLFGSFQAHQANQPLTFATNAARALLAYLAVEADCPHPREQLAALFWPDVPQAAAFANLRQTLTRLRKTLGDETSAVLHITAHSIQLKPTHARINFEVDAVRFEELLAECALHAHTDLLCCHDCVTRMQHATRLYRGELLQGLSLGHSQPFEEWLLFKREELHRQVLGALHLLAEYALHNHAEANHDYEAARVYALRQIELEPWREEAHQQLMRALALSGQRSAALAQFETCRRNLASELSVEPSPQTVALYEQIRDADTAKQQPTPNAPTVTPSGRSVPETGSVFGRQAEAAQLKGWLVQERCKCVAVLGMGGMGKTTLAASMARAVASHFDEVLWVPLLNAPPLENVLRSTLQAISHHSISELPAALDEQLTLLLNRLKQRRCLIVLDNLESILQSQPTGTFRPGYEGYGQLMQRIIEDPHQSCLLFTSREQPNQMARLGNDAARRTLRLAGLPFADGLMMLSAQGIAASESEARVLLRHYSGNPLALKLVTQTIQDLFGGDIRAFLDADALIFDDIRTVLDQQFARLTPLERELLIWLAIEREPTTLPALRANLLQPESPRVFMEALRSLQRRSLLELNEVGFGLQNVILEYVTERFVESMCRAIELGEVGRLNQYSLLNVRAKEYVRQSQVRLLLKPIAHLSQARLGALGLAQQFQHVLDTLRQLGPRAPGYAAGNILNLLLHLGFDVAPYDFSQLSVWQADLRGVQSVPLNFSEADLSRSAFTLAFNVGAIKLGVGNAVWVAGANEGDLCMWHASDGQLRHAFRSPGQVANPIVFSRDGASLAHNTWNFAIRICSAGDGVTLHTLTGHTGKIYSLVFNADGTQLASSSQDGTVRLWDVQNGRLIHELRKQAEAVSGLAFSPDGTWLAGGGGRLTIGIWDTHSGQVLRILEGHTHEVECCAFSSDGALLVSGAHDGEIRVWDSSTGQTLHVLSGHATIVRSLAFHPHAPLLASGSADGAVYVWNASTGQVLHTLLGHANEVTSLSFSADGNMLASGSIDNTVHLWDIRTGYALDTISGHSTLVHTVRFSPNGQVLANNDDVGQVHVWNLNTWAVRSLRGHVGSVLSLAFSPDGCQLASGGNDHLIQVWEVTSGNIVNTLRGHSGPVRTLAYGAGGRVLASGGKEKAIRLWPLAHPTRSVALHGHKASISALAFNASGRQLISASLDHTARLWQIRAASDSQEIAYEARSVLRGHSCALHGVTFSPDEQFALTNSWDYNVCWWEAETGNRVQEADLPRNGQSWRALGIVFSPNGELIATSTDERQIEIRDATTQRVLNILRGHTQVILSMDFHPSSSLLASSSWDGSIRIWDVASGECVKVLQSPGPYVGMNIAGAVGISEAQKAATQALGALS